MAITAGTSVSASGALTTSFTVVIPTVAVDDVLILTAANRDATADPSVTDDDTGGNTWAKLAGQNGSAGAGTVWWKRATSATSGKTITVSGLTGSCCGGLTPYVGVSTGATPYEAVGGEATGASGTFQITTTVADTMVCLNTYATNNDFFTDSQACTSPGALTERYQASSNGGADCAVTHSSAVKSSAGATGVFTWTSSGLGASIAFALLPAAAGVTLTADAGSYSITGTAATLKAGRLVSANAGSYAITGTAATPEAGYLVTAVAGSYLITGTAANLNLVRLVTAVAGSYAITGTAASLEADRLLTAVAGSYVITGTAANLVFESAGNFSLVADSGTYTITGTAASIEAGYLVTAVAGSYAITGTAANLKAGYLVTAVAGVYAITGTAANLKAGRLVTAVAGSYAITGTAANLNLVRRVTAVSGVYLITGTDATLLFGGDITLLAVGGTYVITGTPATLTTELVVSGVAKWPRWIYASVSKRAHATAESIGIPLFVDFLDDRSPDFKTAACKGELSISHRINEVSPGIHEVNVSVLFVFSTHKQTDINAYNHLDKVGQMVQSLDRCIEIREYDLGNLNPALVGILTPVSDSDHITVTNIKPGDNDQLIHTTIEVEYYGFFQTAA